MGQHQKHFPGFERPCGRHVLNASSEGRLQIT
jgi:hypothetical protein